MALILDIATAHLLQRRRQTLVSVLGVAMGVGFFIGIAAMMQGFQHYFIEKVIDVSPHVVMKDEFRDPPVQPVVRAYPDGAVALSGIKPEEELRGIRRAGTIIAALEELDGVSVAPVLRGQVFLRYGSRDLAVTMVGIEPIKERRVSNIEADLIDGKLTDLYSSANGIILGDGVAKKIGAKTRDTLSVISPNGVILRMKVVGVFRTGITAVDNFETLTLLKKAQVLQDRPNVVNQIRLRLADVETAQGLAVALEGQYGYRTEAWQESNQNVLGIFVIQNGVMYSTVGAILIVAAFGIYNIISTVVYEKTRDIAILKSMGLTEGDVLRIFLLQGLLVGLVGTIIGWALGFGITELLASVRIKTEGFINAQGFVLYRWTGHYVISGTFAVIASVMAALIPARKAAKVNPVDIVRGAA